MIKKLSKHGNSLALVIDRSILDLLKIDENTPLEVSTDGQALVVAPMRDDQDRARFESVMASINQRYAKTFRRLSEES